VAEVQNVVGLEPVIHLAVEHAVAHRGTDHYVEGEAGYQIRMAGREIAEPGPEREVALDRRVCSDAHLSIEWPVPVADARPRAFEGELMITAGPDPVGAAASAKWGEALRAGVHQRRDPNLRTEQHEGASQSDE
jgi:hypothetical protein